MSKHIYKNKNIVLLLCNINIFSMEIKNSINDNINYENINLKEICKEEYSENNIINFDDNNNIDEIYQLITNKNKGLFTINEDKKVIFYNCNSKKNRGLFTDNENIKIITIEKLGEGVKDLNSLFKNCINLEYVLINENKFYLENMSSMFENCRNLKTIYGLKNIDTDNVKYMSYMFSECNNLETIDLSNFRTPFLEYCNHMFYNCYKLKNIIFRTNYFYKLFNFLKFTEENKYFSFEKNNNIYICNNDKIDIKFKNNKTYNKNKIKIEYNKLTYNYNKDLDISYNNDILKTIKYSEVNKNNYYDIIEIYDEIICKYFAKKYIIDGFDTKFVRDMSYMFYGCYNLKTLDIGNFKFINCRNLKKMFYNCNNLEFLNIFKLKDYNVQNFNEIFYNCNNLKTVQNNNNSLILNKLFIFKKNENDETIYNIIKKRSIDNFSILIFEYLHFLKKNKGKDINLNIYNENIFENINKICNNSIFINNEYLEIKDKNNINKINNINLEDNYNENKELNKWFSNLKLYNDNIGIGSSAFIIKAMDNLKNEYALKFISYNCNKNLIKNELKYKKIKNILNNNKEKKNYISFSEKHFVITSSNFDDKIFCFVSKFCKNGSLRDFIKLNKLKINLKDIIYISGELINLLAEMENIGLYHGDFNPNNIMIDDNYNLKLIDFSASKYLKKLDNNKLIFKKKLLKINKFGTLYYFSPEQLIGEKIDINNFNKVDIFCFGSIIYELLYKNFPYNVKNSTNSIYTNNDYLLLSMYESIIKNRVINIEDSEKKETIINILSYDESIIYDKIQYLLLISLNKNIDNRASAHDLQDTFIYKLYNKNYEYLKNEFINKFFKYNN